MKSRPCPLPIRISANIYNSLLVVYPAPFRQVYRSLMLQLFRDLSWDSYAQSGLFGLGRFWLATIIDLIRSATAAHWRALEEVLMGTPTLTPMSWPKVLLIVAPGILFGISRVYAPLGIATRIAFLLLAVLVLAVVMIYRSLPTWGLLVLGLLSNYILMVAVFILPDALGRSLGFDVNTGFLGMAVLLWLASLALFLRVKRARRVPVWAWAGLALVVLVMLVRADPSLSSAAGLMVLPLAVGLHLSQRHGSLAALFVVGAYSIWFFDSDTISGFLLKDRAFYPYYALLLTWLFISIGPLFLVRARSRRGQEIGLLAPAAAVLIARVVVPWLARPDFHPQYIWVNEALASGFTLLMLYLALRIYAGDERPGEPGESPTPAHLEPGLSPPG